MNNLSMKALTREHKLLMNLAKASSAGKQSRQLEQFFEGLDNAGWMIELARVHVRLCSGVATPHGVFALVLQMREGRTYRLALVTEDEVRSKLTDLARLALKLEGEQIVARLQRSTEFHKLQRSLAFTYMGSPRRRGRKLEESMYSSDTMGEELEALRIRAHLRIKEWAVRIGTSENTYRKKLDDREVPIEWMENARVAVAQAENAVLTARAAEAPVTDEELSFAFGRVWANYVATTERLQGSAIPRVPESTADKAAREAREDEEMLKYTPSEEEDLDLNINVGTVDETERAQPEDLDESPEQA